MKRYHSALDSVNVPYFTIYWDRHLSNDKKENLIPVMVKGEVGARYKNLNSLFMWQLKLYNQLKKNKNQIDIIHAVDMDTIIPAYIFSRIYNKKIILDIYDKFSEIRNIKNPLKYFIDTLENYMCNSVDRLILVDRHRVGQHKVVDLNNVLFVENIPEFDIEYIKLKNNDKLTLTLCYAGVLEPKYRGIEDLLSVVSRNLKKDVILKIAGFGGLTPLVECYSSEYKNIEFYGQLSPQDCLKLMRSSDVVVGMYYKTSLNNIYASPNKYYEHLLLGRPMLTTIGTPPGKKVKMHDTGWVIEEGEEYITKIIYDIINDKDEMIAKGRRAREIWDANYKEYYSNGEFCRMYIGILNSLGIASKQ